MGTASGWDGGIDELIAQFPICINQGHPWQEYNASLHIVYWLDSVDPSSYTQCMNYYLLSMNTLPTVCREVELCSQPSSSGLCHRDIFVREVCIMDHMKDVSFEDGSAKNQPGKATEGSVVSIHISSSAHTPMTALSMAHLVPGRGIEGDRFYLRRGIGDAAYDQFSCDVTLIEEETIVSMKKQEPPIDSGDSARRNIVVHGCSLSQLAGGIFRIGNVTLRGLSPRSSDVLASEGEELKEPSLLENPNQTTHCLVLPRPDLRAEVLTEGIISIGDRIELV
jgi:hypothetical protein